jgi:hypothetical protein
MKEGAGYDWIIAFVDAVVLDHCGVGGSFRLQEGQLAPVGRAGYLPDIRHRVT